MSWLDSTVKYQYFLRTRSLFTGESRLDRTGKVGRTAQVLCPVSRCVP